jgi:hypothetical protein
VRLHLNEKNLGDYPNRSRAAALAAGRYLKYVDSDDLIYPHGLEVMVRAMEQFPASGFGLCKPDYYINRAPYPLQLSPAESYRWHFLRTGLFGNAPASAIIRRDAFQAMGGFSGKRYVGDVELWLRLGARYPAVILPPGLTWWRSHAEQEIKYEETGGDTVNLFYSVALEALNSPVCPLSPEECAEAIRRLKRDHARHILRLAATGQPASARRLLKAASQRHFPGAISSWRFHRQRSRSLPEACGAILTRAGALPLGNGITFRPRAGSSQQVELCFVHGLEPGHPLADW